MPRDLARRRQDSVLRVLRDAADRPVSLPELRERGIGNPAAVIYELELAGDAIDRVHRHRRLLGVRLGNAGSRASSPPAGAASGADRSGFRRVPTARLTVWSSGLDEFVHLTKRKG